jgi:hypothetical protein
MKNIVITCLCLCFSFAALGQQLPDMPVSGDFNDTPFIDFVREIENKTSFKFYYRQDWIEDVKITFSGTDVPLSKILSDNLRKSGLGYLVHGNKIYIYQGDPIATELPNFRTAQNEDGNGLGFLGITDPEKKYINGRPVSSIEVLEIGDKSKSAGSSKCIVNGRILDYTNSEPLTSATIYIEELKIGAAADMDGRFRLTLAPGKYLASFNYMSMKQQEFYLQVYSSGTVAIEMKKELIALEEVKVMGKGYDHLKGMQMGFERISAKEIKEIPVAFGEKDVLKVAQMLPGVLNVGEGSSGFSVRGSSEDQNIFYINKIPVYNTSHLFGFFGSFNPDIINDFSLYKSNIPASYGGRLSSVFSITTRQGSKRKFFCQGGISPISAHSSFEFPVVKDKVSVVASFRSSYSDWILKKIKDEDIQKSSAFFYDGTVSVNAEINDKNLLKAFTYQSRDKFSLSSLSDYDYSNAGYSLDWKHIFSSVLSANLSTVYSSYSFENVDKTNLSTAFAQKYDLKHYETRIDFSALTKLNHKIEFGASTILYDLNRGTIAPFGESSNRTFVDLGKEKGLESALYLSDEFGLFHNLSVLAGLRYSLFNQLGPAEVNKYDPENNRTIPTLKETQEYKSGEVVKSYSGPEYRLALNYSLAGDKSMKVSYNRLYQYVFMLSNTIAISPNDKWKLCDYHILPPVADQISAGYYQNFSDGGIKATLEIYHKWINNQVEYKDGADFISSDPIETQVLQGKQSVNGIELMINKNTGNTTGWVSYCYSRSMIKVDGGLLENSINNGLAYPANYDRPHSINMVLNHRINRRLSLSTNFVYTTGRPITYPISVYYTDVQQLLYFSKRNEFRIPDYVRLDLSINLEGNLNRKKFIHSSWSVNVYNLLGRKNAYSVYFDSGDGRINGHELSIFGVPILTLSWNYKFGNFLND